MMCRRIEFYNVAQYKFSDGSVAQQVESAVKKVQEGFQVQRLSANHNITMIAFNVCSKSSYVDKEGVEKVHYNRIGLIKVSEYGRFYLQLFQHPNQDYYLFEPKTDSSNEGELLSTD